MRSIKINGFSLVSLLVGLAIAGIVMATVSALYENMTRLNFRANVTAEVENLQRYVQAVLAQPGLCRNALRMAGGVAPTMPTGSNLTPLAYIQVNNGASAPVRIAEPGMVLNNRVTLTALALRHRDNNGDDEGDSTLGVRSVINRIEHRVFPAEVVMTFAWPAAPGTSMAGGPVLQTRKIPLMVTQRTDTNRIVLCDSVDNSTSEFNCATQSTTICPAPETDWTGRPCIMVAYLEDVDTRGAPICKCQQVCATPPTPATPAPPNSLPLDLLPTPSPSPSPSPSTSSN